MSYIKKFVLPLLVCAGLFLLVNYRHQYNPEFTWRSDLWADPAGYYVYLPALFIYDFDAEKFPEKIDSLCGDGFKINTVKNKLFTKYTCGVAILQAPVFLIVHALSNSSGSQYEGFAGLYQKVPAFAAAFYCFLGLLFLFKFLRFYFTTRISALTTLCIFFGTNLYFYSVYGNGHSHVYSFALFSAFLYLTKVITNETKEHKIIQIISWSFVAALVILIRPLNVIFLIAAAFIDCNSLNSFWLRLQLFLKPKYIIILLAATAITFIPQFLYWKYVSGNWIYYSYGNESFLYWKSPQLMKLLFSPNNGLLPYNPIYLIIVFTLLIMIFKKVKNGLSILVAFCLVVYFSASWHAVTFGCGYGCRNFAEYTALFTLPMGWVFEKIKTYRFTKFLLSFLIAVCILINQKAIFSYDRCFFGEDWEYKEFFQELIRGNYHERVTMKDNGVFTPEKEYSELIAFAPGKYTLSSFRKARLTASVNFPDTKTDAAIVMEIKDENDSTIHWKSVNMKEYIKQPNTFEKITIDFPLPHEYDRNNEFRIYIWNLKKDSFVVEYLDYDFK